MTIAILPKMSANADIASRCTNFAFSYNSDVENAVTGCCCRRLRRKVVLCAPFSPDSAKSFYQTKQNLYIAAVEGWDADCLLILHFATSSFQVPLSELKHEIGGEPFKVAPENTGVRPLLFSTGFPTLVCEMFDTGLRFSIARAKGRSLVAAEWQHRKSRLKDGMAERMGFEPMNGFCPLHDFQSCSFDQTRTPLRAMTDCSCGRKSSENIPRGIILCQCDGSRPLGCHMAAARKAGGFCSITMANSSSDRPAPRPTVRAKAGVCRSSGRGSRN